MPVHSDSPRLVVTREPVVHNEIGSRTHFEASAPVEEENDPNWLFVRCFCSDQSNGRTCYLIKKDCGSWFHVISFPNHNGTLGKDGNTTKLTDGRVVERSERLSGPVLCRLTTVSIKTSARRVYQILANALEIAIHLLENDMMKHNYFRSKNTVKKFMNEHFALLEDGRVQLLNLHQFKESKNSRPLFQFWVTKILPALIGLSATKTPHPFTGCANMKCVLRKKFAPKHQLTRLEGPFCTHLCPLLSRTSLPSNSQAYTSALKSLYTELTQ